MTILTPELGDVTSMARESSEDIASVLNSISIKLRRMREAATPSSSTVYESNDGLISVQIRRAPQGHDDQVVMEEES